MTDIGTAAGNILSHYIEKIKVPGIIYLYNLITENPIPAMITRRPAGYAVLG